MTKKYLHRKILKILLTLCFLLICCIASIISIQLFIASDDFRIYNEIFYSELAGETQQIISKEEWSFEDHAAVAESIHKATWNEPTSNWEIYSLKFFGKCDNLSEITLSYFAFFKRDGFEVSFHHMDIFPDEDYATARTIWWPYQIFNLWDTYKQDEITITPSLALEIAENNGGSESRKSVDNTCNLILKLNPSDKKYDGWQVEYYDIEGSIGLFYIDPTTGFLDQRILR